MSILFEGNKEKEELLKDIIRRLHQGETPESLRMKFKDLLKDLKPAEIAEVEEKLIKEGMDSKEIFNFCDAHLELFKESLEAEEILTTPGHPIHILMTEHKIQLGYNNILWNIVKSLKNESTYDSTTNEIKRLKKHIEVIRAAENHFLREENVLFPYLEKKGITQPPKIMWIEHDKIREIKKGLFTLVGKVGDMEFQDFVAELQQYAVELSEMETNHFMKENRILFPTALDVINEETWSEIRWQFDEIGSYCYKVKPFKAKGKIQGKGELEEEGEIELDTGHLKREEIESVFNTLPVDITFVDKNDEVKFFSLTEDRIFVRSKAIIGLKVQQCHPQKSVHIVNRILEDFKAGKRDVADFWINLKGRLVYIRYFALKDKNEEYLGTLEVTQDVSDIKKLEGEKRIYDEEFWSSCFAHFYWMQ